MALTQEQKAEAGARTLDFLREHLGLLNDAALSRFLDVQPPAISKMRKGVIPFGATFILLCIEELKIPLITMRKLLGDAYFNEAVWNGAENFRQKSSTGVTQIPLYPVQEHLAKTMLNDLLMQNYTVVRAGQRSGKSVVLAEVLRRADFNTLCYFGHDHGTNLGLIWKKKLYQEILAEAFPEPKLDTNPKQVLVVIDEPFWKFGRHEVFQKARQRGFRVIVMGSRGPEWDKVPFWRSLGGHAYNTWDLNPAVPRERFASHYEKDPEAARRDFEAF